MRVFDTASRTRALVLTDEADSLFGTRTEARTAVDKYSNLDVNYLLQRLEDFDGVTVFATNYPKNIDQAFKRRIRFKVTFPFPDATLRATFKAAEDRGFTQADLIEAGRAEAREAGILVRG